MPTPQYLEKRLQTRLQTHFRQRPFAKYCILQRYSKLKKKKKRKKKETICKYSACIHLQTKNLMPILRADWRISPFFLGDCYQKWAYICSPSNRW